MFVIFNPVLRQKPRYDILITNYGYRYRSARNMDGQCQIVVRINEGYCMKYEIDFIGINEESSKDAAACCFRFFSKKHDRFITAIYDGGFSSHGKELVRLIKKYYSSEDKPCIDIVICSHSDDDHASGLSEVFDACSVRYLIMNRPWLYAKELYEQINDRRKTIDSLERELKEIYSSIAKLEEKAMAQGTKICEAFSGKPCSDVPLWILSPSKDFFLKKIIESTKTPLKENNSTFCISKMGDTKSATIKDYWDKDAIREGEITSPENETSIVLYGDMGEDGAFLFTGDAGVQALTASAEKAEALGISLSKVTFHQIPHHGGRHNVSPSVLNRIVGNIQKKGSTCTKTAYVSVAKNSDHPKKMVANAYLRRGVKVFVVRTSSSWHHVGTPNRPEYHTAIPLEFSENVESWD